MKKYTLVFAIGVALTLAACGSGSTATQSTDSTAVNADSAAVQAVTGDSTAPVATDSTAK